MFVVTGTDPDGQGYTLEYDTDSNQVLSAEPLIRAWLDEQVGSVVLGSPTGPSYIVSLDEPKSVLAALISGTEVRSVTGDYPLVAPPLPGGAVG